MAAPGVQQGHVALLVRDGQQGSSALVSSPPVERTRKRLRVVGGVRVKVVQVVVRADVVAKDVLKLVGPGEPVWQQNLSVSATNQGYSRQVGTLCRWWRQPQLAATK